MQAGKYVAKSELVDGTEYKFWRHQLADLSDEQLMAGLIATRTCDVEPYKLTWSKFRQLCLEATKREASHQQFKALPVKAASKETREHYMANIRKLLA